MRRCGAKLLTSQALEKCRELCTDTVGKVPRQRPGVRASPVSRFSAERLAAPSPIAVYLTSTNPPQVHVYSPALLTAPASALAKPASPFAVPFALGCGSTALGFAAAAYYADEPAPGSPAGRSTVPLRRLSLGLPSWPLFPAQAQAAADLRPPLPPPPLSAAHPTSASAALPLPAPSPSTILNGASSASAVPLTRQSITDAAAQASPAVVHLVVSKDGALPLPAAASSAMFGPRPASGSGVIYNADGYVLTNAHVVAAAADERSGHALRVTLQDGRVFCGRVLHMDKYTDVAVVKIESGEPLPTAKLGSSLRLRVGEWVVALGSPLMLRHSVTAGIISCVDRKGSELGMISPCTGYIQTDAAINVGNSGGPLLNLDGEVVGLNNMKAVAADGVSFAIPIDVVVEILQQFRDHGRVLRPYVGVTLAEVADGGLRQLRGAAPGLPAAMHSATVIQRVAPRSPAAEAGLQPDDIIFAVAGETGLSMSQIVSLIGKRINSSVDVVVLRRKEGSAAGGYTEHRMSLVPREAL